MNNKYYNFVPRTDIVDADAIFTNLIGDSLVGHSLVVDRKASVRTMITNHLESLEKMFNAFCPTRHKEYQVLKTPLYCYYILVSTENCYIYSLLEYWGRCNEMQQICKEYYGSAKE